MKRKLLAVLVCCALLAAPAMAAEGDLIAGDGIYPGYDDVRETDWFYENAVLCYETGLITGSDKGFEPHREMTVAETAVVAARLCEAVTGDLIVFGTPLPGETIPWYQWYFDYLEQHGVTVDRPAGEMDTRSGFLGLLAGVVPDALLTPINSITELPDTEDADVLRFYNAGILTGVDQYGTFRGERPLSRSEAAAMLSRIVRPALRMGFVPVDYAVFAAAGLAPGDELFGNGKFAEDYLPVVLELIEGLEADCASEGVEFNWFNTVDGVTFLDYVKENALSAIGADKEQATAAYETFDLQVFYSRYLDLKK